MTEQEIRDRVSYHPPSESGVRRHAALSEVIAAAMMTVDEVCQDGREKSLAMTKLEEAKFWASAGVARDPKTR